MANANPSRLGQINQSGDDRALFLKIFAGEVITAFEENNIMLSRTSVRTIPYGKSASFPVIGGISAEYHTPGEEILGKKVNHAEQIIPIDGKLVADAFIADIDEAMNHYDVRGPYTTEMGRTLANEMDTNIFKTLVKAARSTSAVNDGFGGTQISNDKFKVDSEGGGAVDKDEQAKALAQALFLAAQYMDEKNVPDNDRYMVFSPAEYYVLAQNTDLINRDFGGRGAIADGSVLQVAGFTILKSNHVPRTDTSETDTYHGIDASQTVGLGWTKPAVGTVKLMDLALESEYQISRQGTLMVASYAVGHGVLRPECAVELKLDTLTND